VADILIREHRGADKAFLRQMLESAAVPTYPDLQALGRLSMRDRLDEIFEAHYAQEGKRIWIAETRDERPAGMIWLLPSIHPVTELHDWLVINVAVAPEFQRQGIGETLMHHAKDFCLAHGARRLRLFVGARNEAAYRLYAQLGFVDQTREMRWDF
jgi:ribosomal protein S18 acetylase RimI-like enzyme